MACACRTGYEDNPNVHNNQVRNSGRCACPCHRPVCDHAGRKTAPDGWFLLCTKCGAVLEQLEGGFSF